MHCARLSVLYSKRQKQPSNGRTAQQSRPLSPPFSPSLCLCPPSPLPSLRRLFCRTVGFGLCFGGFGFALTREFRLPFGPGGGSCSRSTFVSDNNMWKNGEGRGGMRRQRLGHNVSVADHAYGGEQWGQRRGKKGNAAGRREKPCTFDHGPLCSVPRTDSFRGGSRERNADELPPTEACPCVLLLLPQQYEHFHFARGFEKHRLRVTLRLPCIMPCSGGLQKGRGKPHAERGQPPLPRPPYPPSQPHHHNSK